MESQQMNLDVISNNLANVNTTGYKMSKLQFQDLLYQTTRAAGSDQGGGNRYGDAQTQVLGDQSPDRGRDRLHAKEDHQVESNCSGTHPAGPENCKP